MLLNTKQVRALASLASNVSAQYTDKTIKNNKASKRRSVVFCFRNAQDADALAQFLRNTIANKVTRTGVAKSFAHSTFGGEYVRIIADIA
jgi:hypothetical protein